MTDALVIAIGVVAVLAAAAVFAIAFRRPKGEEADWRDELPEEMRKVDRGAVDVSVPAATATAVEGGTGEEAPPTAAVAVIEEPEETSPAEPDLVVADVVRYQEVSEDQQGVNRRMFLNRALGSVFFFWLAGMGAAYLSFMWPRVSGGFGADIDAGDADALLASVLNSDGTVTPLFLPEARSWIVPISEESLANSQFADNGTVAGGLVALFQTCVHLGCRVPWCSSSQGFECPCHGSAYSFVGEYSRGPAPRNLDRFVVNVNDRGRFVISTGSLVATARAQGLSVSYPQGPSCI